MKKVLFILVLFLASFLTFSFESTKLTGLSASTIEMTKSEIGSWVPSIGIEVAKAQEEVELEAPPVGEKEPKSLQEAAQLIPTMISFAKNGQWLLFGSVLSLLLTFLFRQYGLSKLNLGAGVLPLVSGVLGIVSGVGGAVLMGSHPTAALLAVMSGPAGSWLWSALAKHFFPAAPRGVRK